MKGELFLLPETQIDPIMSSLKGQKREILLLPLSVLLGEITALNGLFLHAKEKTKPPEIVVIGRKLYSQEV